MFLKLNKKKGQRYAFYIATAAVVAGLYTIATLLIQPLAFGPVQFRISEALTILPVFTPAAIPGPVSYTHLDVYKRQTYT